MNYLAYNLTEESKQLILNKFVPSFENIVVHHITYKFGVPEDSPLPPDVSEVKIIGFAKNDNIECVVCSIDGRIDREIGGLFHITISHTSNCYPKDSNDLLEKGYQSVEPINIHVVPALN